MSNTIVSITQMKNESSILPVSLARLDELVDYAVIIDDHSEDNSVGVVKNSKMHKEGRIALLENKDSDRKEGREFNKCFKVAKEFRADIIYISDCDEIVADGNSFIYLKDLLRNTRHNIRIKRAEIAIDQGSIYGIDGGTGKLVVAQTNDIIGFDLNSTIHCSQPPLSRESYLLQEDCCVLLHYGPSCVNSQIVKCLSYVLWDNLVLGKSVYQGYNEYFRMYENFVMHGKYPIDRYFYNDLLCNSRPYKKWLPEELESFCNNFVVELFTIIENDAPREIVENIVNEFCKLNYVKEKIIARANH